jgi:hypothetical protein
MRAAGDEGKPMPDIEARARAIACPNALCLRPDVEHSRDCDELTAAIATALRETIEECEKIVAKGVNWAPRGAFSDEWFAGSKKTAEVLAKILSSMVTPADSAQSPPSAETE